MRCWRSRDQAANAEASGVVGIAGCEGLQQALFEHLDLLLRILQRRLAVRKQRRAALVGGERLGKRKLAALHAADELLELGARGLETVRGIGCIGHWERTEKMRMVGRRKCERMTKRSRSLDLGPGNPI